MSDEERCDPCRIARDGRYTPVQPIKPIETLDGGHLILVKDEETGIVSYRKMFANGHLGAVED